VSTGRSGAAAARAASGFGAARDDPKHGEGRRGSE
jgi:hypothetical protein